MIINKPLKRGNDSYNIGVSVGLVKVSKGMNDIEELIKASDKAMYQAKKNGGNQ